jgi:hypothetical protein
LAIFGDWRVKVIGDMPREFPNRAVFCWRKLSPPQNITGIGEHFGMVFGCVPRLKFCLEHWPAL